MNFDRLASHYNWMEAVSGGGLLQRARTVWLEELISCRKILSAGEGHGRFAAACSVRFPQAELTCIEASSAMIAAARARIPPRKIPIQWHHTELLSWSTEKKHDAIVTCFFLDCFPPAELAAVVKKLADCAAPHATWLVVDFALPPRGLARWRARAVHAIMYTFFGFAVELPAKQLTSPDELLRAHGFVRIRSQEFDWGLLRSDVWRRT